MPPARSFDLDEARKARAEIAGGEGPVVTFGGQQFRLPDEMPFDFAAQINDGKIAEGIRALFDDQAEAFFALKPSIPDMIALADWLVDAYGMTPGKSEASSESSTPAGEPSRPTSNASTVATSA